MPVRLTSDSARETQGGRSRLRQLASFGRYGADMQASANSSSSQLPAAATPTFRDCGVLAASLSSFYGWVAKQADHKVNFGKKIRDRLLTKQQGVQKSMTTAMPIAFERAEPFPAESTTPVSTSCPQTSVGRMSKQQQNVLLPAVFTMQGISANTACFNSLSYQAGGARIHGLMQYQTTLDKADLYLDGPSQRHLQTTEASVARLPALQALPADTGDNIIRLECRARALRQKSAHPSSPVAPSADSNLQEPWLKTAHQQCDALQTQLQLPLSPDKQPPNSMLEQHVPYRQLEQMEFSIGAHASSKQQQHQLWGGSEGSQQATPPQTARSDQTARSSQSDATHLNHHDSHNSDVCWQEDCQQPSTNMRGADEQCQLDVSSSTEAELSMMGSSETALTESVICYEEDCKAGTCSSGLLGSLPGHRLSVTPLACMAECVKRTRSSSNSIAESSISQQSQTCSSNAERGVKGPMRKARQPRQLADITNICKARAPASPAATRASQDAPAGNVGDMMTFWEQRTNMR